MITMTINNHNDNANNKTDNSNCNDDSNYKNDDNDNNNNVNDKTNDKNDDNNDNDTDKLTSVSVHGKKLTHVWDVLNYLCSVNRHGFRDRYLV